MTSCRPDPTTAPAHMPAPVMDLLRRHGRETTSFQILEPGLAYWLAPGGDACVAYADTGGAWVAVGAPVAPPERVTSAMAQFTAAARARGRRIRWFAVEQDSAQDTAAPAGAPGAPGAAPGAAPGNRSLARLHIGEQPSWDPAAWPRVLGRKRSLREQLRRARAKGVTVRRASAAELADPRSPTRRGVDALIARWKDSRQMAPMGFVVQLDLHTALAERRIFIAEHAGAVAGVLAAVPVPARQGWFFEDVLRHPHAPNGTIEMLFDHAMRALAAEGSRYVTYGLAPLAHTTSPVLRWIRDHTRWLYHFDGLRAFKAKLMPDAWQPVYLAYPDSERGVRAIVDVLAAFAHGSFLRFGLATLRHRAAAVTRLLALLLLPWTAAMLLTSTSRWFPGPGIKAAWIGFDLAMFCLLMALARRWRKPLAVVAAAAALLDFGLGCVQAAAYNLPAARGAVDGVVMFLALAAPLFAAGFLWACRDRAQLYRAEDS